MNAIAGWLGLAWGISFLLSISVLPILAAFRRTRRIAGSGYLIVSYVIGASLWIMCFLTVFDAWSLFWALVGTLILGVGVLPMSLIIFAKEAQWALFVEILILGGLVIGLRMLGAWLVQRA